MRGTLVYLSTRFAFPGIIPAYAGNTSAARCPLTCSWDHPRVCGEHSVSHTCCEMRPGSSPRMRGTLFCCLSIFSYMGIIPAYAGNTRNPTSLRLAYRDHPRVCGEHFSEQGTKTKQAGSSPRMRGTLAKHPPLRLGHGIIPAYAGNTLRDYSNFVVSKFMSFVFHLV